MLKQFLLALATGAAASSALAANELDDIYLEKIRFIQYHAPNPTDYRSATQRLIQSVNQSDGLELSALGRAFMRIKDFDNALGVLVSTVRISPRNADAQADLAYVSAALGKDCQLSRAAYERAVTLNPVLEQMWHMQQARSLCSR